MKCEHNRSSEQLARHSKVTLELVRKRDMSRNAHNNKNGKKENMLANLANMAKMTILPQSPTGQSTKQ